MFKFLLKESKKMTMDEYDLLRCQSKAEEIKKVLKELITSHELCSFNSDEQDMIEAIEILSNDIINTENNYPLGG